MRRDEVSDVTATMGLPAGYSLEAKGRDRLVLRRADGSAVCAFAFSAFGPTPDAVREARGGGLPPAAGTGACRGRGNGEWQVVVASREVLAEISPTWGRPKDGPARLVGLLRKIVNDGSITFRGNAPVVLVGLAR